MEKVKAPKMVIKIQIQLTLVMFARTDIKTRLYFHADTLSATSVLPSLVPPPQITPAEVANALSVMVSFLRFLTSSKLHDQNHTI